MIQRIAHTLLISVALIALLSGCGETPLILPSDTPTLSAPGGISTSLATAPRLAVDGQPVSLPTEDSARQLEGTLYGKSHIAVIFSNMGAQRQETWDPIAKEMAARSYMVLTYNMRYWITDTEIEGILRNKAAEDLRAAIAFARSQGAKDLVLVGASLGGLATAKVAATEKPLAVIIMAAPMSANGLDLRVDEAEARQITAPKLFIYSQDESPQIRDGAQQMYDLSPQPKELYVYPGMAHGTSCSRVSNA